jgi:hypothetical protein
MASRVRSIVNGPAAAFVVGLAAAAMVLPVPPANAWTVQAPWSNITVSCNHGTYESTGYNLVQTVSSTFYVAQTADPDNVVGEYHLRSDKGNNTSAKVAANGQIVSWEGVLPSRYEVWHTAHVSVNCNGVLPGDGNTVVSGWARFD